MTGIFSKCSSLSSLPDISKWDIQNATYLNSMFYGCKSLASIPDLSKWDIKKVINMENIFGDCSSLLNRHFLENNN